MKAPYDIHARAAASLFGVSGAEVTPGRRRAARSVSTGLAFGPAAFLAKLEEDAPERARQILDRVWIGKGNLTQGEAEWLDKQHPGDAWPVQKALAIAARDGNPPPKIAAKHFPPPPPTTTETP